MDVTSVAAQPSAAAARPEPRNLGQNDTFLWPAVAIVLLVFVGSFIAEQLGDYAGILVIFWGPLLYKYMFLSPPHISARVLLMLALILEPPDERAGNGYWVPPFRPASQVMYAGLKQWSGL